MRIRNKILIPMTAVAVVCATVIGLLGVMVVNLFVNDFNDQQLSEAYTFATTAIEEYKSSAERAGAVASENDYLTEAMTARIADGNLQPLIDVSVPLLAATGVDMLTVTDAEGTVLMRAHEIDNYGDSVSGQANVREALKGTQYVTIEAEAESMSVLCGTPVYEKDRLIGVVSLGYRLDRSEFTDRIKSMSDAEVAIFVGDTQLSTTISNNDGKPIEDIELPASVISQVLDGNDYIGRVSLASGKSYFSHTSAIRGTAGMVLGMLFVGLDTSATDARMTQDTWIMAGVIVLLGILSIIVSWNISTRISRPIKKMSDVANEMARGNVQVELSVHADSKTKDETLLLEQSFADMISTNRERAKLIQIVASGDLSGNVESKSKDDMVGIALTELLDKDNFAFREISSAATRLNMASSRVSDGAQSLAQGAVEQAASVEEVTASLTELQTKTNRNAENSAMAREANAKAELQLEDSMRSMDDMLAAMEAIGESSDSITKIIKVIDELAFQTNILSLNAAVEAAHAGQYGKGFAVVAEEVGTLANKSAQAAKNTALLIAESSERVKEGNRIVERTNASLRAVLEYAGELARLVDSVDAASAEQAKAIEEINQRIEQISIVVHASADTAGLSAAAAQEMSGQSAMLDETVSKFKLRKSS